MLEVKANALEDSFDAILQADRMTGLETRIDALDEAMERQVARAARPPLDGAKGSEVDPARAAFIERYLRRGVEAGVELKSFSGATGASGGYAVPREIDQMIEMALKAISPIRSVANVVRTGSAGYRKLVTTGGVVSGWAAEGGARPDSATPTFQEIAPPSGELYANPSATQAMLDDAQFDVEGWLSAEIAQEFAKAEGAAFVSGNGTNKPKGFLTYTATSESDAVRAFGSLQYVASGAAGGFAAAIPRLYGTIRVAGTVIWSTDLQENSAKSGGGKGKPSMTSYSYSASFAVALSARQIISIGRIWADGNLLRGAAGDFKSPVGAFRMHPGGEDQPVDPLIAADVGMDLAPAFRGCAYVVFDGLQLADFGNRIPSITFEVVADAGALGVAEIASDLAGVQIAYAGDMAEPALAGFAADGADLRDATAALIDIHDLLWREADGLLTITAGETVDDILDADRAIRAIDGEVEALGTKQRLPIEAVPARLSIRHHDPARDFQIGIQTAERPGPGLRSETVDLPAVLSAASARQLADRKLRTALRRRSVVQRAVGWTALDFDIGNVIRLSDEPGSWLVEGRDWDNMAVRLTLRAYNGAARSAALAGEPGAPVLQGDAVQGATHLAIVELPSDGTTLATAPAIYAAATGEDAGWRRAALLRYRADPETAEPIGRTAPRAVLGATMGALPHGEPWRIDRRSTVDVLLDNDVDALTSVEDSLLLQGANLCVIGEEVLQFGSAEPVGPQLYRLRRLIRGWHGTEWATEGHGIGERFVLLDRASLASIDMSSADVGQLLELRAIGSGDLVPAEASRLIDGRAMSPPAPVHGRIAALSNGDLVASWVRRSRLGWNWTDHGDVPLGEERESYIVQATAHGAVLRAWEVVDSFLTYSAAEVAEDGLGAGPWPLRLEIRQRGTMGISRPLMIDLP